MESQESIASAALDRLKARIKELIDLFKDGFKAGFGDDFEASLQRIKDHAEGIKNSLKGIFTDPEVVGAANTFANNLAYALGQIAGSIVSVGATIAENLIGGIDKYLEQNSSFIKDRLAGIFNEAGEIVKTHGNLAEALASIFEVFRGDTAKQITADIIAIIDNGINCAINLLIVRAGRMLGGKNFSFESSVGEKLYLATMPTA